MVTSQGIPLQVYLVILQALRNDAASMDQLSTFWGDMVGNFSMVFCSVMPKSQVLFQGI